MLHQEMSVERATFINLASFYVFKLHRPTWAPAGLKFKFEVRIDLAYVHQTCYVVEIH